VAQGQLIFNNSKDGEVMNRNRMTARIARLAGAVGFSFLVFLASGCADSGHPRGMFSGYVMDKSEEEVTDKVGKPDTVDKSSPDRVKWVYKRKTFDPDNNNKPDAETIVIFKRDAATGKLKVAEVDYT
jgi:hypothetical protein